MNNTFLDTTYLAQTLGLSAEAENEIEKLSEQTMNELLRAMANVCYTSQCDNCPLSDPDKEIKVKALKTKTGL